jgi:hypothetical protein
VSFVRILALIGRGVTVIFPIFRPRNPESTQAGSTVLFKTMTESPAKLPSAANAHPELQKIATHFQVHFFNSKPGDKNQRNSANSFSRDRQPRHHPLYHPGCC